MHLSRCRMTERVVTQTFWFLQSCLLCGLEIIFWEKKNRNPADYPKSSTKTDLVIRNSWLATCLNPIEKLIFPLFELGDDLLEKLIFPICSSGSKIFRISKNSFSKLITRAVPYPSPKNLHSDWGSGCMLKFMRFAICSKSNQIPLNRKFHVWLSGCNSGLKWKGL